MQNITLEFGIIVSNNTKVTKQLLQVQSVMISTNTCFPDKDQSTPSS